MIGCYSICDRHFYRYDRHRNRDSFCIIRFNTSYQRVDTRDERVDRMKRTSDDERMEDRSVNERVMITKRVLRRRKIREIQEMWTYEHIERIERMISWILDGKNHVLFYQEDSLRNERSIKFQPARSEKWWKVVEIGLLEYFRESL